MTSDATVLADLVELRRGSTYKSSLLEQPGPVLLGLSSISPGGGFRRDALKTYAGDSPAEIILSPGEIYVSLKDVTQSANLLGAVARVPADISQGRLTQDTVRLIFKDETARDYVYWLLRTPQYREYCRTRAIGVTTLALPREDFLAFSVPPRTEQGEAVLQALQLLDQKIEHNHRVMARVRAAVSAEAEHLLRSAQGGNRALSSLARFVNGGAFTKLATGSGRPILRIRELNAGVGDATPRTNAVVPDENVARHNDLLFSWSATLEVYRWFGPESLINQHIFKVIPNNDSPLWLVEAWIRLHLPSFRVIASDKAVTMGHIRRKDLDEAMVPVPADADLDDVRRRIDALDDLRGALAKESSHLLAIRDQLLPKLVSGDLRISESYDRNDLLEH
jgi:type I restriction enzyme, S subunit